ncbi:ethanolamine ammonia-lyase subunit EutC [Chachezhania sediminis]|uniref:ethanolamine ammonia-lyase subunit EutC n=1 Tax=Chachezhania sediminis TaxID=2599291 RepID=UPI00131C9A6E|nr:ethanolamine ammonia-lyase subunit EutC [Chachezhania sediminis]
MSGKSRTEALMAPLKAMTEARIGMGRSGGGLPTRASLAFALDHARAKEAVWSEMDRTKLAETLADLGPIGFASSRVSGREEYLTRPDLGRLLGDEADLPGAEPGGLAIVVADGLSATAVELNAAAVLRALVPALGDTGLPLAGIVLARQARVALGDEIAQRMGAAAAVTLIGERPGLSASDSLGAYISWAPRPGMPNADRTCISNIRSGGLVPDLAAAQIARLLKDMKRVGASGLEMKARLATLPAP